MPNWLPVIASPEVKTVTYIDLSKASVIEHDTEAEVFIVYFEHFNGVNGIAVERRYNDGVYRKIKEFIGEG
jgi:hypothetical protein